MQTCGLLFVTESDIHSAICCNTESYNLHCQSCMHCPVPPLLPGLPNTAPATSPPPMPPPALQKSPIAPTRRTHISCIDMAFLSHLIFLQSYIRTIDKHILVNLLLVRQMMKLLCFIDGGLISSKVKQIANFPQSIRHGTDQCMFVQFHKLAIQKRFSSMTRHASSTLRIQGRQPSMGSSEIDVEEDFRTLITRIEAPRNSPTAFNDAPPSPREVLNSTSPVLLQEAKFSRLCILY